MSRLCVFAPQRCAALSVASWPCSPVQACLRARSFFGARWGSGGSPLRWISVGQMPSLWDLAWDSRAGCPVQDCRQGRVAIVKAMVNHLGGENRSNLLFAGDGLPRPSFSLCRESWASMGSKRCLVGRHPWSLDSYYLSCIDLSWSGCHWGCEL